MGSRANPAIPKLEEILHDNSKECPLSLNQYLPLDILQKEVNVHSVLAYIQSVIRTPTTISNHDLAEKIIQQAKGVFATLIFVGRENAIEELLSEGLTDKHLPLSHRGSGADRNLLCCRDGSKIFETFRDWRVTEVNNFLREQWRVQAPVFDIAGSHFTLGRDCALPLEPGRELIGTTGFSRVYKCALYPSHYRMISQAQSDPLLLQVAIKELYDQKSFEHEKDILTRIQNLNDKHLVKHIATCQIDSKYYVIFPLANGGNLLEYWKKESETPQQPELILWAFQQLLGITGAIRTLHHDLEGDKNCRHGDIKPANILIFKQDGRDLLVIADLGVSKIHEQVTEMRRSGTDTRATTPAYEAPEVLESTRQGKPRARTYDIWSLGCVFLEFAIWLLYDFTAVENFEAHRSRPLEIPYPNTSFYSINPVGKAEILSDVSDAIEALREDPRCKGGTALGSLVDLIATKLLVIAVERRCKAEELHEELRKIVEYAEQDLSRLLNTTAQPPPVPKVFLPVRKPSKTL